MGKAINLVGQQKGWLTILERIRKDNRTYYFYECKCGKTGWMRADILKNASSCGCKGQFKAKDITGKKFGRLKAIKKTEERDKDNGSVIWECECKCGNIAYVAEYNLSKGSIRSCGCLGRDNSKNNIQKAIKVHLKDHIVDGTNIPIISRTKLQSNNTSGATGVTWDKSRKKWRAYIRFKGKIYHLGRYADKDEAIAIRKEAEEKIFKPFLHKKKISKQMYEIIQFKVAISASEVIRTYKLILNGTIDRFPHGFWEDIKENELKLLLQYFFEVVLKWKDEDFYINYNIDIFKKYKLLGMAEIIFKSNTSKILNFVYPKRFKNL